MSFGARELNLIGHWPSSTKIPERYGRIVCSDELPSRNTIIQKVVGRWEMVPPFHLPETIDGACRIGKKGDGDAP